MNLRAAQDVSVVDGRIRLPLLKGRLVAHRAIELDAFLLLGKGGDAGSQKEKGDKGRAHCRKLKNYEL